MQSGLNYRIANHRVDGADQARPQPGRAQNSVNESRSGRFAIGSGNADHHQLARRMTMQCCAHQRQCHRRIRHKHLRHRPGFFMN